MLWPRKRLDQLPGDGSGDAMGMGRWNGRGSAGHGRGGGAWRRIAPSCVPMAA
jgi:hypothetical protein